MIDHLQFNKEPYYPLQNLGTLVGKHVHPISKQILVYEGSHISNIYRLYEDHNVGNETIYAVEITGNGVFSALVNQCKLLLVSYFGGYLIT